MDLKAIVRTHRKRSGLTQAELAALAGVGKTVIFDIEKGKVSVRWDTLKKVLHVLNISVRFDSPLLSRVHHSSRTKDDEKG